MANQQNNKRLERRAILQAGIALSGMILTPASMATTLTPETTAGPFYPNIELPEDDADLTRITGRSGVALGDITDLSGTLMDQNNNPIKNARIEIWQCDVNGRYRHTAERSKESIDRNFQGFGFTNTDQNGQYMFRTIKPVAYLNRAPHIHVKVLIPGGGKLITQLYIAGDKNNDADGLYRLLSDEQRERSIVTFNPVENNLFKAQFNIIV